MHPQEEFQSQPIYYYSQLMYPQELHSQLIYYYSQLIQQIEYYFSDQNLRRDEYLRGNMDGDGWVSIQVAALHCTARHGTARHGTARHGTARHGTAVSYCSLPMPSLTTSFARTDAVSACRTTIVSPNETP